MQLKHAIEACSWNIIRQTMYPIWWKILFLKFTKCMHACNITVFSHLWQFQNIIFEAIVWEPSKE